MFSTRLDLFILLFSAFVLVVEPQEIYDTVNPGSILFYGSNPRTGKHMDIEDQTDLKKPLWEHLRFTRVKEPCTYLGPMPCIRRGNKRVDASDVIYTFPPFAPRPGRRDNAA